MKQENESIEFPSIASDWDPVSVDEWKDGLPMKERHAIFFQGKTWIKTTEHSIKKPEVDITIEISKYGPTDLKTYNMLYRPSQIK